VEAFGRIVLDRQVCQLLARHQRQADGDPRDPWLVQGVLDKLADQTTFALLLGLAAESLFVYCEPLAVFHENDSSLCVLRAD